MVLHDDESMLMVWDWVLGLEVGAVNSRFERRMISVCSSGLYAWRIERLIIANFSYVMIFRSSISGILFLLNTYIYSKWRSPTHTSPTAH